MGGQQRYQATKQFPVTIVDDDDDEGLETFTARLVYADPIPSHLTGGNSTVTVTISDITVVNQPPVVTGNNDLEVQENRTGNIARYSARDPEGGSFSWSVAGSDGSFFSIDSGGNLSFDDPPDFEASRSNIYNLTVVATDTLRMVGDLAVKVTVTNVNEPPTVSGDIAPSVDEGAENFSRFYTASDPEGVASTFTWSLSGTDSGDFNMDTSTGELTFRNTPDYESPADSNRNNEYLVQVQATDAGNLKGVLNVTIEVEDVNESPTISGDDTLSNPENTATNTVLDRYSATDPERRPITWSVGGTDSDDFSIDASGNLYFVASPDHEAPTDSGGNNVYEIQVIATDDGNLMDGTPSQLGTLSSTFDVTVTVTPVNEPPTVTGETTLSVDENTETFSRTYSASDPEGVASTFTWSLAGTDNGDFNIDRNTGELTFRNTPDYERPADSGGNNHYEVIVQATDSTNQRGELHVDVIVTPVDEPPTITGPGTVDDFPENSATSRQVGRYSTSDPEEATVIVSLTGTDSDDFTLASNGTLTFDESPDYEERSRYSVTIRAAAGSHTADRVVTINIQNIEERGTVTLSTVQPQEGTQITATLEDDDGPTGTTWQWYRASSSGSTGTAITNADSRFYTPVEDDVGRYLRAVASYDDGHGTGKSTHAVSANRVQEAPAAPEPPVFPADGDYDRTIRENLPAGRNVGAPVTATDGNNDRLTYSIATSDQFEIASATGQLRTRTELDREDRDQHFVSVTATDPGGLTDTVSVTVTVEDVDEQPEVSGPDSLEFQEGTSTGATLATYTSTDPDLKGIDLVLSGTDSEDFTTQRRRCPRFQTKSPTSRSLPTPTATTATRLPLRHGSRVTAPASTV